MSSEIKDSLLTWATIFQIPFSNQFEDDCGHKFLTTDQEILMPSRDRFDGGSGDQILVEFGLKSF